MRRDVCRNRSCVVTVDCSSSNQGARQRAIGAHIGRHAPDIGFAADPFFRGIDLLYGADGGVFIADWSDTGECHDDNGVFRQSGRIYKFTHGQTARPSVADVAKLAPQELLPLLAHKNEFFARHARKRLQELAAAGADLTAVKSAAQ